MKEHGKNLFSLNNIKKICEENKINVLFYIYQGGVYCFVNNEKDKEKLKLLYKIKPYEVEWEIKLEKSMTIEGFVVMQAFEVPFFKETHEMHEKINQYELKEAIREYKLFKNRMKRFFKSLKSMILRFL